MTVDELKELIADMPGDAIVLLEHELIGDEHEAVSAEYNSTRNAVILHECIY